MTKLRMWWIAEVPIAASTRGGSWTRFECYDSEMKSPDTNICVIEKSAYDELEAENKALKLAVSDRSDKYKIAIDAGIMEWKAELIKERKINKLLTKALTARIYCTLLTEAEVIRKRK